VHISGNPEPSQYEWRLLSTPMVRSTQFFPVDEALEAYNRFE